MLLDFNKDKKIYVLILIMKLSLRFWISKVFKFLLVQFEFNEINRLVLKPSRADKKKFKYVGDLISEVYDIVHLANISFHLDCDDQKFNFSDQSRKQTQ